MIDLVFWWSWIEYYRSIKDYTHADEVRELLKEAGYMVEYKKDGVVFSKDNKIVTIKKK